MKEDRTAAFSVDTTQSKTVQQPGHRLVQSHKVLQSLDFGTRIVNGLFRADTIKKFVFGYHNETQAKCGSLSKKFAQLIL